jgi:hypothetical protein
MKHSVKNLIVALLLIAASGAARMPLEQRYTADMRERQLLEPPLNLDLREELGQTFFIAVLGGFRSVVATFMELKTVQPYLDENWGLVDQYYAICCKLQPRDEAYWESRAWHLAANARDGFLYDQRYSEETRHVLAQQSVNKGIAVLLEGTKHRPDSGRLWERLGYYAAMPWNDLPDHSKAAEYYAKAAATPGARRFYYRFHVYELAQIPGREMEAWDKLMELYKNPEDNTPRVELSLLRLFKKVSQINPQATLPQKLRDLFTTPISQLTPDQVRHRRQLEEAFATEEAKKDGLRPPRIESPGLNKPK